MKPTQILLVTVVLGVLALTPARAQTSAFTYQGRLNNNGAPANGVFDFSFRLFDAASGPTQVGDTVTNSLTAVGDGLFTVTLDFGAGAFSGGDRWLEISVRTNGGGAFTSLTPRQKLASTPYAIRATEAANAANATTANTAATATSATTANNFSGALGGDVTGTQGATTVAMVGGQTAANVASGVAAANDATSANTASAIVKRDGSGNFAAGAITATSVSGDGAGLTTLNASQLTSGTVGDARLSANVALLNAGQIFSGSNVFSGAIQATNEDNQFSGTLAGDVLGNAATATTANSFAGPLAGDVTGTQGATVVASVGGLSAATIATGAGVANSATPDNTAGTVVRRDGAGNFAAGTIAGNLTGNATTATTANNFSGALSGDVTGTQGATTVASVGGQSAASVAGGANAANAATSANVQDTIVKRDGSGNFAAAGIAADSVSAATLSGDGGGVTNLDGAKIVSGTVGNAQLAANAVQMANLAAGAVGSNQLATGAAVANLNASGQSGISHGGVILSADPVAASLITAGFIKIGQTSIGELWSAQASLGAPSPRYYHSAVWTGRELIVWGGLNGSTYYGDGARYNPALNTWTPVSAAGAPSPRAFHHALWTGSEMLIWGGSDATSLKNTGARYNPDTDSWTPISDTDAPTGCVGNSAVWTGSEMMVWGGRFDNVPSFSNDGGRYDPITDSWTPIPTNGAPSARTAHIAVWNGTEMVVWGGAHFGTAWCCQTVHNDGARFNPTNNSWTSISASGAPLGRYNCSGVWTGDGIIVWGGTGAGADLNNGAIYTPANDTWANLPASGAPSARDTHTAVWTGKEMIIWGGEVPGGGTFNDGARYNPALAAWSPLTTSAAPSSRYAHTAIWTGFAMLVMGGATPSTPNQYFNDIFSYQLPTTMYLYLKP